MSELNDRQETMRAQLIRVRNIFGPWEQDAGSNGASYIGPEVNIGAQAGVRCGSCVFFEPANRCEIVKGEILPDGKCQLRVIPEDRISEGALMDIKKRLKSIMDDDGQEPDRQ